MKIDITRSITTVALLGLFQTQACTTESSPDGTDQNEGGSSGDGDGGKSSTKDKDNSSGEGDGGGNSSQGDHFTVSMNADPVVIDDSGSRISWEHGDEKIDVRVSVVTKDGLPDLLTLMHGVAIDLKEGAGRIRVSLTPPKGEDLNLYVLLVETATESTLKSGDLARLSTSLDEDGNVFLVRLNPPDGCDRAFPPERHSTFQDLRGVYRLGNENITIGANATGLEHLECLMMTDGDIDVTGSELESFDQLPNLLGMGQLEIWSNARLKSINLPHLMTAREIHIYPLTSQAVQLIHADWLNGTRLNFAGLGGNPTDLSFKKMHKSPEIEITDSTGLVSLEGLSALRTARYLTISGNANLTGINALAGLETIYAMHIVRNPLLDAVVFPNITRSPDGSPVHVIDVAARKFVSFPELTSSLVDDDWTSLSLSGSEASQELSVPQVEALSSLTLHGLGAEAHVDLGALMHTERFKFYSSTATELTGLDSLETVRSEFRLQYNTELISLKDLTKLKSVGSIWITDNRKLPDCEVQRFLEQLERRPSSTTISRTLRDACSD